MKRQSRIHIFILCLGLLLHQTCFANWKFLEPGIAYQDLAPSLIHDWSHLHAFKIDLKRYELKLVQKQETEKTFPTIFQYAAIHHASLAFNGGFFDEKQHPLGLRISTFHHLNSFKNISWWGVFYIENQHAFIRAAKAFRRNEKIEFAIQSGPRLLINGVSPSLHPGYAERTALCVLANQEIVVIISQYYPLSLKQLADILKAPPLQCKDALNLDGGSSTQFLAKFPRFYRHMPGLASVADAITVIQRK
jgi:uncharacterized protein YigE (DUF2233 family)